MHRLLLDIPMQLETQRMVLRCYRAGDGPWYYEMAQRNRDHLAEYEAGNVAMSVRTKEDAEVLMRDLANDWASRKHFFFGAFDKQTGAFVAQVYVGPVSWDLPEFQLGYFADTDHEGRGYVTEAVRAVLSFVFEGLGAQRVRLECDDRNARSYRLAERCGLVREGHFLESKRRADGTLAGTLRYRLLRSEFEKLRESGD
jgi:RimJ/RimL family protein N-acetyltransferase